MTFNPLYTTAKSKWYLCFCCLWSRCCSPPDKGAADYQQLLEEYTYLDQSISGFFHLIDWESLYPMCKNFLLTKQAEAEAKTIYGAYISGGLDALEKSGSIQNFQQVLKFWRWLNSDRQLSLLHHTF